jgi:CheY-like chemotaxis protein
VVNDAALDKGLAGKSILWVDDRPANNIYERQAMEALGIRFTISTSTEEALQML